MLPPSSLHEYLQLHHRTPCTPSCTTSDIERAKAMALELQDEQRTIRIKTRPFDSRPCKTQPAPINTGFALFPRQLHPPRINSPAIDF